MVHSKKTMYGPSTHAYITTKLERRGTVAEAVESQSREHRFKSCTAVSNLGHVRLFNLHCHSSFRHINEYLAIHSGYLCMSNLQTLITTWQNVKMVVVIEYLSNGHVMVTFCAFNEASEFAVVHIAIFNM